MLQKLRRLRQVTSIIHLSSDDRTRGRPDGEIPGLLKALINAGVVESNIECISSEQEAVETALKICNDGDLLLIFADKITRSEAIIYFHDTMKARNAASSEEPVGIVGGMLGSSDDTFMQDERGVFGNTAE